MKHLLSLSLLPVLGKCYNHVFFSFLFGLGVGKMMHDISLYIYIYFLMGGEEGSGGMRMGGGGDGGKSYLRIHNARVAVLTHEDVGLLCQKEVGLLYEE